MSSKHFIRLISALLAIIISATALFSCGTGEGTGNSGDNTSDNSGNNTNNNDNGDNAGDNGSTDVNGSDNTDENAPKKGNKVGDVCYGLDLERVGGGDTVNIEDFRGKIVIINFWGTWCNPCKAELPHFDEVATEYADDVVILVVHSVYDSSTAESYVNENFPSSNIIFLYDTSLTSVKDKYYTLLGGDGYYPYNIVLDKDGVITYSESNSLSKNALVSLIEDALR